MADEPHRYPSWLPEHLEPVVARLARADQVIYEMADQSARWSMAGPLTMVQYRRPSDQMTKTIVTAIRPIPPSVGLLFSEAIHHLRAVLDNVVWGLLVAHSGEPDERVARKIAMPIYEDEPAFMAWSRGLRSKAPYLARPGQALYERVRSLQPFVDPSRIPSLRPSLAYLTGQRSEEAHPLTLLQGYSNSDKHRTIRPTIDRTMVTSLHTPFLAQDRSFRQLRVGSEIGERAPWGEPQVAETNPAVMIERPTPHSAFVSPTTEAARLREWVADFAVPHLVTGSAPASPGLPATIDLTDSGLSLRDRIQAGGHEDARARMAPLQHERFLAAMREADENPVVPEVVDEEWTD